MTYLEHHFDIKANLLVTKTKSMMSSPDLISDLLLSPEQSSSLVTPSDTVTKIILVTQYRGGSSFIGKMFSNHPDVFYWFEPLIFMKLFISKQISKIKMDNR